MSDQNWYLPGWLQSLYNGLSSQTPALPTAMQAVAGTAPNATGQYDNAAGSFLPGNVSISQNMQLAAQHSRFDLPWFASMVHTGGPWDYKQLTPDQKAFRDAGNFNYGATGTAMGLPQWLLDRAAGAYQYFGDTRGSGSGNPLGAAPYGDSPRDQQEINRGIAYARRSST